MQEQERMNTYILTSNFHSSYVRHGYFHIRVVCGESGTLRNVYVVITENFYAQWMHTGFPIKNFAVKFLFSIQRYTSNFEILNSLHE